MSDHDCPRCGQDLRLGPNAKDQLDEARRTIERLSKSPNARRTFIRDELLALKLRIDELDEREG